jgi:hypothetical protein
MVSGVPILLQASGVRAVGVGIDTNSLLARIADEYFTLALVLALRADTDRSRFAHNAVSPGLSIYFFLLLVQLRHLRRRNLRV